MFLYRQNGILPILTNHFMRMYWTYHKLCFIERTRQLSAVKATTFGNVSKRFFAGDTQKTRQKFITGRVRSLSSRAMDDDEQLKQAIALSLRDRLEGSSSEQQEQHEMKQALALSLGKTVEQLTARDMMRLQDSMDAGQARKRPMSDSAPPTPDSKRTAPERFWDGAVRLTYVKGFTLDNAIRFEDIVQKSQLRKALITAMVVSTDWIEEQFPADINLCVVLHGRPVVQTPYSSHEPVLNDAHRPWPDSSTTAYLSCHP